MTMTTPSSNSDPAQDNYGAASPSRKIEAIKRHLRDVSEDDVDNTVKVRAWIQKVRMQGKKVAFVELREERDWAIQAVVIASATGTPVSKQMVKWVGSLRVESFVVVEGTIKRPVVPVKSCRVSNYEIHLTKVYCVSRARETLRLGLAAANRAVSDVGEEVSIINRAESQNVSDILDPAASLSTHLNNPAMRRRAPVYQAIADIRLAVHKIFSEYLDSRGFKQFFPPYILATASEGGADVFEVKYFDEKAYLAQSPQFYKQIEIAGGQKKVYCIGPAFRAENSNTTRHLTEVC